MGWKLLKPCRRFGWDRRRSSSDIDIFHRTLPIVPPFISDRAGLDWCGSGLPLRNGRRVGGFIMKIPRDIQILIESGCPAHLVTVNPDGSPQVTLVWLGIEGDELVVGHLSKHQKVKNILRDPRVAISLQSVTKSALGLTEYAVLYGEARIQEGGAPELLRKLAAIYLGPAVKFPPMESPPPGYVTRIRVDRVEGVGPWTGRAV
jgi:PPOX class probable F420-dependent enzyme